MASSFAFAPAGYSIETVLVASEQRNTPERASVPPGGVNSALLAHGDFLMARHNKTRAKGDHNVETQYLGYSTTAWYFYNLCDCIGPGPVDPKTGKPNSHNRKQCASVGTS